MNVLSLSYNYVQNQSEPLWKDDPFDLKGFVTGVTRVDHKSNLAHYAFELVTTYAVYSCQEYTLSLDMLPDAEQNELARLYLEAHGREVSECIYGDDFTVNNEFTCALLNLLKNDCKETRDHFAEVTLKNTLVYFKSSLDELLSKACENYLHSVNNENGYYAFKDSEHGDIVWGRF